MSTSKTIHLNDDSIDKTIESNGIVVLDFWADWCGPCKMMSSIVDELSEQVPENVIVAKVDVDECGKAAAKFKINSIPTFIFFKDGQEKQRIHGLISLDSLLEVVQEINV